MLGTFISVLKAEREAMKRAVEQMDAGRTGTAEAATARFRQEIADLEKMVARIESRRR